MFYPERNDKLVGNYQIGTSEQSAKNQLKLWVRVVDAFREIIWKGSPKAPSFRLRIKDQRFSSREEQEEWIQMATAGSEKWKLSLVILRDGNGRDHTTALLPRPLVDIVTGERAGGGKHGQGEG